MSKSNFFAYLDNGSEPIKETLPQEKVAQDQDTVISDAMCEASQLIYEVANQTARCIAENAQVAIDLSKIRKAELAYAYMAGVDFGLAMDDKVQLWYLAELGKCISSIRRSRENGFQDMIYVPPEPGPIIGFDGYKCSGHYNFIWRCMKTTPPKEDVIRGLKEDIVKDKTLHWLFKKGILNPLDFPGAPMPEPEAAKNSPDNAAFADSETVDAEDDSPSVLSLRNLYRQNRIDKNQYVGSLATLLATGLINKSQFTRLKAGA